MDIVASFSYIGPLLLYAKKTPIDRYMCLTAVWQWQRWVVRFCMSDWSHGSRPFSLLDFTCSSVFIFSCYFSLF